MSQIVGPLNGGISPVTVVQTLTSNSGGVVSPTGNNINVVGDGTTIVGVGNPGTSTITFSTVASGAAVSSFDVYKSATSANVTGDGTVYTVIFDSAISNVGADYNAGTGVYTAPVTGTYIFAAGVTSNNYGAGHSTLQLKFAGSVNTYTGEDINSGVVFDASGAITSSGSIIIPMTAGDTMSVTATVSGSTLTVGVAGQALTGVITYFQGSLLNPAGGGGGSSNFTLTSDAGVATSAASNIDIVGGAGVTTSAVGDTITITATGTSPASTCSFVARLSVTQNNVTGDGTAYPIIFDTELTDAGGDYNNATGIFTAPATGLYTFSSGVRITDLGSSNTREFLLQFVGTSVTVEGPMLHPNQTQGFQTGVFAQGMTATVPMVMGETMRVVLTVWNAVKVVDLVGGATMISYFSGYRVA